MSANPFDDDEPGFFARNKTWMILLLLGGSGAGYWYFNQGEEKRPVREEKIVMISPLPPPPPPPKPKPTPPPVETPKVVENKPRMDDSRPDDPRPEPPKPADPPQSMGSNIKGAGDDGFGLSGSGNGGFVGIGGNGTGRTGNGYGRYASQVKSRIVEVLRQDKRTRSATFDVKLKIWIDSTGTVTRAEPAAGSDSANAAAVLVGVRLAEAPPSGMPMPLTASLLARRP